MKTVYLLVFSLFFSLTCFSQQKVSYDEIFRLRSKFCKDCYWIKLAEELDKLPYPPPPPLEPQEDSDKSCKRIYNIPTDSLLNLYPFDADRIFVAIPVSWTKEKKHVKIIAILNLDQKKQLVDILYNYFYKKRTTFMISFYNIYGCEREAPSLRFIFHHGDYENYMDIMTDQEDLEFIDSFSEKDPHQSKWEERQESELFWGGECTETFSLLQKFIKKNFGYEIASQEKDSDIEE